MALVWRHLFQWMFTGFRQRQQPGFQSASLLLKIRSLHYPRVSIVDIDKCSQIRTMSKMTPKTGLAHFCIISIEMYWMLVVPCCSCPLYHSRHSSLVIGSQPRSERSSSNSDDCAFSCVVTSRPNALPIHPPLAALTLQALMFEISAKSTNGFTTNMTISYTISWTIMDYGIQDSLGYLFMYWNHFSHFYLAK